MFKDLKKIELHLHLDGSVRVSTVEELLNENNLSNKMIVDNNTKSLTEYLTKFDLPIKVMQKKENLIRISKELVEDLDKDNVIYAEIRFAPIFHINEGLTLEDVVNSVLEGLKSDKVKTNLILCMMRNSSYEDNKKILDLAIKYKNKGVCAIDLAGDESKYPTNMFKHLFEYAKNNDILFTIHAGEAGTINDMIDAINYGTKRIGHGIKAIENSDIINKLIENKIALEICPTSNIQTCVVDSLDNHPIKQLNDNNVLITINTDNRTVSNTTLSKEYELLNKHFNFTKDDFVKFNINAINSSFLNINDKDELIKKIT